MVLEVLRRTALWVLLLLISLGFGHVRLSLERKKIALIALPLFVCVTYISYRSRASPIFISPAAARSSRWSRLGSLLRRIIPARARERD